MRYVGHEERSCVGRIVAWTCHGNR
jgi:hypothetical protein